MTAYFADPSRVSAHIPIEAGLGPLPLYDWVRERLDNCIRISAEKTDPDDRASWLEDASYFRAILAALDSPHQVLAERERCAKIADGYALRAADNAQVVLANAAEEARAAISYETKKAIAAHLKDKQNFLHGNRHCAVEIAKDIREGATPR